jgi:hypothetical protein
VQPTNLLNVEHSGALRPRWPGCVGVIPRLPGECLHGRFLLLDIVDMPHNVQGNIQESNRAWLHSNRIAILIHVLHTCTRDVQHVHALDKCVHTGLNDFAWIDVLVSLLQQACVLHRIYILRGLWHVCIVGYTFQSGAHR